MPKALELAHKTFGRWKVLHRLKNSCHGKAVWMCECECGKTSPVLAASLVLGESKSCGCLNLEVLIARSKTHGLTGSPEYYSWQNMWNRCRNKNLRQFKDYGERGITVCKRWEKFENFLADMGTRKDPSLTLERVDNEKGYYPSNCVWDSRKQQNNNTRRNRYITYAGATKSTAQWADEYGIPVDTLYERLNAGWDIEKALLNPVIGHRRQIEYKGEVKCLKEWSDLFGITYGALKYRLRMGMSFENAVNTPIKYR